MTYSIETCLNDLRDKFKTIVFEFREVNIFKNNSVPIFLIQFENELDLLKSWEDIYKTIALDFQTKLTNEFSIWNIYLVFQTNSPISKQLKYNIENNTFSSRKIVIENDRDFNTVVNEKILSSHLKIENPKSQKTFEPNKAFWSELKDKKPKLRLNEEFREIYIKIKSNYEA